MTKDEKKNNALDLFIEYGFSKKKIAKFIGVSVQTISAWAEEDDWDETRAKRLKIEKNMKMRIHRLVDHTLEVFESEIQDQHEKGEIKHLDRGQIDGLSKLLSGIKTKEMSFNDSVKLLTDFAGFVNGFDNALAKLILPYTDSYISELRKQD